MMSLICAACLLVFQHVTAHPGALIHSDPFQNYPDSVYPPKSYPEKYFTSSPFDFKANVQPAPVSGFWGMPPPPDSPFMVGLTTPRSLLEPPTTERRSSPGGDLKEERSALPGGGSGGWDRATTTTGRYPAIDGGRDVSDWSFLGSAFGKGKRRGQENIAIKWCNRYELDCKDPKRDANELSIRITGGQPAPPKKHPHMVMVGYGPKSKKQWLCGGSLISEKYVITAAHCINTSKSGPARWVRLGDLDISTSRDDSGPQELEVAERIPHPRYREPRVYNDIALLRLAGEARLTAWVRPICLQAEEELSTRLATITGWGRTDFVSETSPELMEVDVSIFNSSSCKSLIDPGGGNKMSRGYDPETMICAGAEAGGKDACQGDSGGPLVVEGPGCSRLLVGITSVGKDCGLPNSPGVYTRVSAYIRWIEEVVTRQG